MSTAKRGSSEGIARASWRFRSCLPTYCRVLSERVTESAVQSVSAGNAPAPTGPPPSSAMQSAFAKGFDERAARRQAAFEGPSPVVHVEGLPTQSDAPLRAAPPPISLRKAASQQSLLSRTWSAIFGKAKPTAAPIAPADDNSPDSPPQQQMSPEKKPDAQLPSRNLRSKHKRDLEAEAETKEEPKPTPVYGRRRDSFIWFNDGWHVGGKAELGGKKCYLYHKDTRAVRDPDGRVFAGGARQGEAARAAKRPSARPTQRMQTRGRGGRKCRHGRVRSMWRWVAAVTP